MRMTYGVAVMAGLTFVAWLSYAFFTYWWYKLGMDAGFRGEVYGPVSYFRPRSLWLALFLSAWLLSLIRFTSQRTRDK